MGDDLVNISSQFQGLPMGDLIGGPLNAACQAQVKLAQATADFIKVVGFMPPEIDSQTKDRKKDANGHEIQQATRTAFFRFKRPVDGLPAPTTNPPAASNIPVVYEEEVELEVPLLAIVKVPSLSIKTVDITFDMEVKSSCASKESSDASASLDAQMSFGWGCFKGTVNVHGAISSHKENTRSSDNSAKYHVAVHAEDSGTPEGLARVLDILQTACAPKVLKAPSQCTPTIV